MPQPQLTSPRFVVVVKGGPVHDLADQLEYQAELLARVAPGLVLCFGPRAFERRVDRVRIVCLGDGALRGERARKLAFVARASRLAAGAIRASGLRGLLVSYDPFVSGVVARIARRLAPADFICEVNGAFANPDNVADAGGDRDARTRRRLRFAAGTLRRADGIRLLYPTQLDGFPAHECGQAVRTYFDPVPLARFADLGEEPVVLFVGHPFRRKGVDVLMRAFASIRADFPDWRLVLVGHELAAASGSAGVSLERIDVRPPTSNAQLAPLIGRCGVLVLPSRSDAMGRVLLEAAAAGKPRIGARVDGIPTVIDDGRDGLLFAKEDVAGLADALARLLGSPELRHRLGEAARARVARDYSGERFLEHFVELAEAAAVAARRRAPAGARAISARRS